MPARVRPKRGRQRKCIQMGRGVRAGKRFPVCRKYAPIRKTGRTRRR